MGRGAGTGPRGLAQAWVLEGSLRGSVGLVVDKGTGLSVGQT